MTNMNGTIEQNNLGGSNGKQARLNLTSSSGKLIVTILLYAVWAALLTVMANVNSEVFTWVIIIVCVAIGWKCVTSIQPRMFLFLPVIGWVIYFAVKFFVSLFAGLALTPWQAAKWLFLRV